MEEEVKYYPLHNELKDWQAINCDTCTKRECCISYERLTQAWFTESITNYQVKQIGGDIINGVAVLADRCKMWREQGRFKLPI